MVLLSSWVLPGMSRDLPNQLISDVISYANPAMALSKVVMVHSEEAKKLLTCVGLNESCGPAYWCCGTNTCQFSASEFRFRCISCGPTDLCFEWLLSGSTSLSPGIFLIYVSCSYLNVCNKGCICIALHCNPLGSRSTTLSQVRVLIYVPRQFFSFILYVLVVLYQVASASYVTYWFGVYALDF